MFLIVEGPRVAAFPSLKGEGGAERELATPPMLRANDF